MTAVSKEMPPDKGGHKMTAVSKEMPPDNGGHKMTAVSKEIQPLVNVLLTGGAQKSLGISNLAPRGKMWNDNHLVSGEILTSVR